MASKGAGGVISKFIRPPWKYTGPASGPEFLESLVKAGEYRPFAPTNAPVAVQVPAAETDKIYDIKYFTRDSRRTDLETKTESVTLAALKEELAAAEVPPAPGSFYFPGKDFPLEDDPGDGYQK